MVRRAKKAGLQCPWCGEPAEVFVDPGSGQHQRYVEDCAVCCRPCIVSVEPGDDDEPMIWLERE
jgi:hypothetical protein